MQLADAMFGYELETATVIKRFRTRFAAHGVFVSGEYAYVADGEAGIKIIDIDPPESAGIMKTVDTQNDSGIFISGGYAYVAHTYGVGLTIIDIDPLEDASIYTTVDTSYSAYNVKVSDGYAYLAGGNGLRIVKLW
jgi:hypothetical protein